MHSRIWLSSPHMSGKEMQFVEEAYESNWIAPLGKNVDEFELTIQNFTGSSYCASLSSGTAAIHLALILCDVKKDDYVLCQSMTFAATANPIKYVGATPVFIDSEPDTWNMSPELLEEAIIDCLEGRLKTNDGLRLFGAKRPKAIIPVHLYGMPANMSAITRIAEKYDIPVIEDAAESIGSEFNHQATGTFGTFGIFSFNGNKIITTSSGGAIVSNHKELIEKAKFLATQARDDAAHYEHSVVGYNYRLSNVLAGIGRGQMEILSTRVEQRRRVNNWYRAFLEDIDGVSFQSEPSEKYFSNYWLTAITLSPQYLSISAEELRKELEAHNIESRPLWKPMHLQPVFRNAPVYNENVSELLFECGLCLPSGSNLSASDLQRIKSSILNILL